MKKTTLINLSGMAFRIEEDAYEHLYAYLDAVKARLGMGDDASETVNDIELRMTELFSSVVQSANESITLAHVEGVIKTLGNPEEFGADSNDDEPKKKQPSWKQRRLYRDPRNRVVGGVCSGLATYFNIDPIIFRLLFVLGLFYGISILPYILLWIVIPKAITIEQRAQMTVGRNAAASRQRASAYASPAGKSDEAGIVKALRITSGTVIIIFNSLILLALTISFFAVNISIGPDTYTVWLRELTGLFFDHSAALIALIGALLIVGIPAVMVFYLGLHLIFSFKRGGKLVGFLSLALWLCGIGLVIYAGVSVAMQFRERTLVSQTDMLQPVETDTIHIKATSFNNSGRTIFRIGDIKATISDKRIEQGNRTTTYVNRLLSIEGRPRIYITHSSEKFAVTLERESFGSDADEAAKNASNIEYFVVQNNNELLMDGVFTLAEQTPVRGQRLIVKLEIPEGKHVEIVPEIDYLVR